MREANIGNTVLTRYPDIEQDDAFALTVLVEFLSQEGDRA